MAKKVKFALEMANGEQVRNLEDLKEHFDIDKVVSYFNDGRLLTWLKSRYYEDEAEQVEQLTKNDPELPKKLCAIFGVESEIEELDVEENARRTERLNKLKQYTDDREILKKVDLVAFDQEELGDLLDEGESEIYLCNNKFTIPLRVKNKTYIGVGKAIAVIRTNKLFDFDAVNITFKNVRFDDAYAEILKEQGLIEEKKRASENALRPKKLYEEADAAWDEEDYETAFEKYKEAAELGYTKAFAAVGYMYEFGKGVESDDEQAERWYKLGMEKDDGNSYGFYADHLEIEMIIDHEELTAEDEHEIFKLRKKAVELDGSAFFNYKLGQMYRFGEGTKKNLAEAFSCFKAGHDKGNYDCTNILGVMFMNGEHVDENPRKAIEFFNKAVDKGNSAAMGNLAECYLSGDGVEKNERKAFELYKRAAEAENNNAMNMLGNLYFKGTGTSVNYKEARRWFQKAADNGNTQAMNNLAFIYREGKGTSRNISKAIELYNQSAELGNTDALISLGTMYRDGDGVREDNQKAAEYFQRAADAGNSEGAKLIGELFHYYSEGTQKNGKEAFYWYQQAAENGDAEAMNSLGNMFLNGDGVDVDDDKAFYWYKRSAEAGYAWGICHLGIMYRDGKGTSKNIYKAIDLFTEAGELGLAYAWSRFAWLYYFGNDVAQDYSKAFNLFKRAADGGDEDAMDKVGDMYRYGEGVSADMNQAFMWYKQSAESGCVEAMNDLGNAYSNGTGTAVNYNEAFYWYQKAAEKEHAWGTMNLAYMYRNGRGVSRNPSKAIELYTKAAELGRNEALTEIGSMYKNGDGVSQDYYKAAGYFKAAADAGEGDAMNFLALMYDNGQGVAKDSSLAFQWYLKAAQAGSPSGMSNLSLCYLWGDGTSRDLGNAEYWMNKAAEAGNYLAMLRYADAIYSQNKRDYRLIKMYETVANAGYGEAAYRLSVMYRRGYGTQRDEGKASYWTREYQGLGYTPDQRIIDEINNAGEGSSSNSSSGSSCFITTAVCDSFGKPDDCFELMTFRKFRDTWLAAQPDGKSLIGEYYSIAPKIVTNINKRTDAAQIYKTIWKKYLEPCLKFIERGDNQSCKRLYVEMVNSLRKKFL